MNLFRHLAKIQIRIQHVWGGALRFYSSSQLPSGPNAAHLTTHQVTKILTIRAQQLWRCRFQYLGKTISKRWVRSWALNEKEQKRQTGEKKEKGINWVPEWGSGTYILGAWTEDFSRGKELLWGSIIRHRWNTGGGFLCQAEDWEFYPMIKRTPIEFGGGERSNIIRFTF